MFVPQEALNQAHPVSAMCRRGTRRKQRRLLVDYTEEQMGRVFPAYGTPLTVVSLFQYLLQKLLSTENDRTAVERNLRRERGNRVSLAKILGREGTYKITTGRFYVAVVQAVLLFGSKTWVLTPQLDKSLKGFHHWVE